jgi:serine/threonine-protein kinase ULK2
VCVHFVQAPEVLNRSPYTDVADLWSMGVVLFQLVCGKVPFTANNIAELTRLFESRPV